MNYQTRHYVDLHIVDALEEKWASVGLAESTALRYRLRFTRINIVTHYCWDVASFNKVIETISNFRFLYRFPRRAIPYLHIASHGKTDKDGCFIGITLGDSDVLTWTDLSQRLLPLQRRVDYTLPISLSTCGGFNGYQLATQKMEEYEKKRAFHTLVGPEGPLPSAELFNAFAAFYSCLLDQFRTLKYSVSEANSYITNSGSHLKYHDE